MTTAAYSCININKVYKEAGLTRTRLSCYKHTPTLLHFCSTTQIRLQGYTTHKYISKTAFAPRQNQPELKIRSACSMTVLKELSY